MDIPPPPPALASKLLPVSRSTGRLRCNRGEDSEHLLAPSCQQAGGQSICWAPFNLPDAYCRISTVLRRAITTLQLGPQEEKKTKTSTSASLSEKFYIHIRPLGSFISWELTSDNSFFVIFVRCSTNDKVYLHV